MRARARLGPQKPPPLPKLGMHCVGSSSALFFALMSSISAALAARAQPLAPAAVPISSGRLAELGSGNPSAGSSAGASNPLPATPALWEAPAVGGAAGAAAAGPAGAAEDAEDPKGMQAAHCAALLAAVAAVQVQMVLAQLSKKTVSWFAAGARYGPEGEGVVVWVTRGALTSRRQVEHRAPIGQTPPNVAKVVLDLAIFDRSVAVCGELGVPDQLRILVLKEYRSPADRYSKLRGQFEQACQSFKKAEQAFREGVWGKRQGGQGVKSREGKLRAAATTQQGRAEDLLGQMRGAWEEAKKRRLLKAPFPKMPPSTLPPFGKWEVTGGHQEELLHGVVFAGHPRGWEVYDLAATAVSRSCTQKPRDRGVSVRMHTAPDSCNRHNCMYVAVKIILWHMSHPVGVWDTPPALSHFAMWGRQCRELLDKTLAWAQVKGSWKCRRTGWGPAALKEMKEVSGQLAPVGGAKGLSPLPPSPATWYPLWYFFASRTLTLALLSLVWVRGKGRGRGRGRGG